MAALTGLLQVPAASAQEGGGGSGPLPAVRSLVATPQGRLRVPAARVEEPVEVDGVLDDGAWGRVPPVELAWEVAPGDNEPAPVETRCQAAYDDEMLYLGCVARDPDPDAIRAFVTDRDDIGDHDRIVFTLDPFNDARRAFEFGVSALGVQWDAVFNPVGSPRQGAQDGGADASWDAIWSSAGRITDDGYVVEAAIPFASLRFPADEGPQTWGFFVSRLWPRDDAVEIRSMHWDRRDACVLCQANLLVGLEDVEPGGGLQLTPTLTGRRSSTRTDFPSGPLVAGEVEEEVGVDGRWRITSDLTLNGTINPDFSQVEADAPQLSVNNRFALFFPEKRPFFLEGADLFSTPVQAVFTRTIASPSWGAKLSGKSGPRAVGLLLARDRTNTVTLPGSQFSSTAEMEGGVTNVIGRYRRDVGSASTVGGLLTMREGEGYHNRVAGADAFLRLGASSSLQLQYLRSETRYPAAFASAHGQPEGSFGGHSFAGTFALSTRSWEARFNSRINGAGFRADAGFVNQVDLARHWGWVGHRWWAEGDRWWTSFGVNAGGWSQRTLSEWSPVNEGVWLNANFRGPLQSNLWINPDYAREGVGDRVFEHPRVNFGGNIRPGGKVTVGISGTAGGAVDFTNVRQADQLRLSPSATLRVGRRLDLRGSLTFQRLDHESERIFDAVVSQLRAVYNFDARTFVRAIVQYRRTERNPELYLEPVDPESRAVSTQLLFSYKLNPLSVVFLGYGDSRVGRLEAGGREIGLTPTGRTVFVKLGYAWRP